ncbi:MAG: hypothetical protein J6S85_01720 [Methanobrevibacter sp.]|nr:hypothetical protein [Methanobrevibacter sp.]MBO7712253.1 hypothetical protein [Methanobrevibacter sp.]
MKKIAFVVIFLLLCNICFSENDSYEIFSWETSKKDIYNYFINKDWELTIKDNLVFFIPKSDYYFLNFLPIQQVSFVFDKNQKLKAQFILLNIFGPLDRVFDSFMFFVSSDKANIYKIDTSNSSYIPKYNFTGNLENCDVEYSIIGNNNYYTLAITYMIPDSNSSN